MTRIDWSNRKRDMVDLCFYTYDAKNDTIIDDDEKFQLISVISTNPCACAPPNFQTHYPMFSIVQSFSISSCSPDTQCRTSSK